MGHKQDISFKNILLNVMKFFEKKFITKMLEAVWGLWTELNKNRLFNNLEIRSI